MVRIIAVILGLIEGPLWFCPAQESHLLHVFCRCSPFAGHTSLLPLPPLPANSTLRFYWSGVNMTDDDTKQLCFVSSLQLLLKVWFPKLRRNLRSAGCSWIRSSLVSLRSCCTQLRRWIPLSWSTWSPSCCCHFTHCQQVKLSRNSKEGGFHIFDCHRCHNCQRHDFCLEQAWRGCSQFDPVAEEKQVKSLLKKNASVSAVVSFRYVFNWMGGLPKGRRWVRPAGTES